MKLLLHNPSNRFASAPTFPRGPGGSAGLIGGTLSDDQRLAAQHLAVVFSQLMAEMWNSNICVFPFNPDVYKYVARMCAEAIGTNPATFAAVQDYVGAFYQAWMKDACVGGKKKPPSPYPKPGFP